MELLKSEGNYGGRFLSLLPTEEEGAGGAGGGEGGGSGAGEA